MAMKNVMKTLMVCLVVILIFMAGRPTAMAQLSYGFPPLWSYPAFSTQPQVLPTVSTTTGDILIDNFEYWDSPYNHGWMQNEPAYPTYGFGMGYASIFNTVLDLQEGSRVLDVYRQASVFLLGTPYAKHAIMHALITPPNTLAPDGENFINVGEDHYRVLSFQFRAPLGIETWDIFELDIIGFTGASVPNNIIVRLLPKQPTPGSNLDNVNNTDGMYAYTANVTGLSTGDSGSIEVTVHLGRGLLDGSWHVVWIDLFEAVKKAVDEYDDLDGIESDWYIAQANTVVLSGQMFRFDNLMFRSNDGHEQLDYPDLFEMGPLYAQIFEPYTYLFVSDYAGAAVETVVDGNIVGCGSVFDFLLDPVNYFLYGDPNDPTDEVYQYWVNEMGADPNLFGQNDPDLATLFGVPFFIVDFNLPIFADPNLRFDGSQAKCLKNSGTLGWNATINGYGANGIQAFLLEPLSTFPYDGMPTYLPAYYNSIETALLYQKPSFPPGAVLALEAALWNSGISQWPNVAALNYTPQYFEDLIVTIEVTNGVHSDIRTIPISVVNYPVENYPPVLQLDIDDQIFYVGETGVYLINFIDPDCFIFSQAYNLNGQTPATTHVPANTPGMTPRDDMSQMVWNMTINGLPSYQYGPWINSIINPCSGIISWVPQFEGAYNAIVTCSDNRGGVAFGEVTIFCVNSGTWLNHPPIVLGGPTQPVTMVAGQEFILHTPNFSVEDPDGDALYASCNIGSCGRASDGSFIWTFQSNFPGSYMVEIVFYDIRGGYAVMEFFVDVKPWWSYPSAFIP